MILQEQPLNLYWAIANLSLAFIYFALLVVLGRALLRKAFLRRLSSYFSGFVFVLMFALVMFRLLFMPESGRTDMEVMLFLVMLLPAGLFVFLRREALYLAEVSIRNSENKFDRLKDEFLTVASHELRTPMSVINGFAEILVREKIGPLNDEQKRRIRKILMQGQRLNRIIDELLDLSRIRSGRIEVKKDIFDVIPVLKSCLDDQLVVCEQQNIRLVDELPDILPDVEADLERVTQVVVNLLGNAIKYTRGGGEVLLTAEGSEKEGFVKIIVRDSGIGIAPANHAAVFDEFFRVSSQNVQQCKGSGLGLAIVKQLVEAQSGEVGLHSEGIGKGSSFYFTLPVAKHSPARKSSFKPFPKVA